MSNRDKNPEGEIKFPYGAGNQIIIYNTEDGETEIEVRMKDETV